MTISSFVQNQQFSVSPYNNSGIYYEKHYVIPMSFFGYSSSFIIKWSKDCWCQQIKGVLKGIF